MYPCSTWTFHRRLVRSFMSVIFISSDQSRYHLSHALVRYRGILTLVISCKMNQSRFAKIIMELELYIPTEVGTFLPSFLPGNQTIVTNLLYSKTRRYLPRYLPILFCSVSRWKIRDKLREICPNLHCISRKISVAEASLQVPRQVLVD